MTSLVASIRTVVHRVWRFRVRAPLNGVDERVVMGVPLAVTPGVLHPALFASSRFLGDVVRSFDLRGTRVADLGTGSGFLALLAARGGAVVTAIDISSAAAACARTNVARNSMEDRVSVVESDVFDGVSPDLRFDYVISNPPFYLRDPVNDADRAFAAGARNEFFRKLGAQIRDRLCAGGRLVLVHSSDADFDAIRLMLTAGGLRERSSRTKRTLFETLTIREFVVEGDDAD